MTRGHASVRTTDTGSIDRHPRTRTRRRHPVVDRTYLIEHYDDILARGCLTPEQRDALQAGHSIPEVVVQASSGSSGGSVLRIPRTRAELDWLAAKLLSRFVRHYGRPPVRVAFLGGISHLEAGQKVMVSGLAIQNFSPGQLDELGAFDPEALSLYPSFARQLLSLERLEFPSLRAIKLGGEPVLPVDLEKLFARFPHLLVIEQFGSTEMPGIAIRSRTRDTDGGYELSADRFSFRFGRTDGWRRVVVKDEFTGRAFPIPGWFKMDDEVLVRGGAPLAFRRRGDPAARFAGEADDLLRQGCTTVQIFPRERRLLYESSAGPVLPSSLVMRDETYRTVREKPFRLVDSNKMPLVIDTRRLGPTRLWH